MLIDSHAHLDMQQFEEDIDQTLMRALDAGISYIINIGSDIESSIRSVELASNYEMIYAAVGIHPHEARGVDSKTYDKLTQLCQHEKTLAIGEIGLDYHYMHSPVQIQHEVFIAQLELANRLAKPVVIHQREAYSDTLHILRQYTPLSGGVIHCFSGDESCLEEYLKLGFHISIAGPVTFKKSQALRKIVPLIPDNRLLIETDSPYLTPTPYRGRRNEPAYIKYIAQTTAQIKGLALADIIRITILNTERLFGITRAKRSAEIVYPIRKSLYINLTNRCTNNCTFCARQHSYYVKGHDLKLDHEPGAAEILNKIDAQAQNYTEIVFCGFGEPLLHLDTIVQVSKELKKWGYNIRINTNGQANLIYGRNILPELKGLVDALSVSVNAECEDKYLDICRPEFGAGAYQAVKEFILLAKEYIPQITVTVLDIPDIDVECCRRLVENELGVNFRLRTYNQVG